MKRWAVRMFWAELAGELLGWLIYRRFMRTAVALTNRQRDTL